MASQLRQSRHLSRSRAADLDRAKRELAATRARATAFANQQDEALQRVAALEATVARLRREQEGLMALLRTDTGIVPHEAAAGPRTEVEAGLRAEIAALLVHRDEARLLRQSLSWRVTRPLRAIRRPRRTLRILFESVCR